MTDISKMIEKVRSLATDSSSTEEVETIGGLVKDLEALNTEREDMTKKHEDLRNKYIDVIKNAPLPNNEVKDNTQTTHPKSLEECFNEQISKRKNNQV